MQMKPSGVVRFTRGQVGVMWLKLHRVAVAGRLRIDGRFPIIENLGKMNIGHRLGLRSARSVRVILKTRASALLAIGDDTFINEGVSIVATQQITIGNDCLIGDNVQIHDSDYHQIDEVSSPRVAPIAIGRNVWIGRNSIICPGVSIGDHSIIGAASVVTKSVPSRKVYAGVPAKEIRDIVAQDSFVRR